MPAGDAIRTRPPVLRNIHISNVRVGNVTLQGSTGSCFQALVAQGPAGSATAGPIYIFNVRDITLRNVRIGGHTYNEVLSDFKH